MKEHVYLDENEMIRRAVKALLQDLGPIETARFLNLAQQRRVDSVLRHRLWQEKLDRDRFFDQVFGPENVPSPPAT